MSCPFNKESLAQLKAFVSFCSLNPNVLHNPDLSFFKQYLESLGASIPPPKEMPKEDIKAEEVPPEPEEKSESEPESDLELDTEGCIEPDKEDPSQEMGDFSKDPTEAEVESASEKRSEAIAALNEGDNLKAVELFTEAINLNPTSAVLYVKRGQAYLKLNKPNACIKDCTRALELNPDSAAAYKFRGRSYRLIAEWEKAVKDLRQASNIDFDEQTDEWLKEVTPNAQKIEQHKLKKERKRQEKEERERAERLRKIREAREKAANEASQQKEQTQSGNDTFTPPGGMQDFYKLLQDPEIMTAFQDPEVAAAFQDISSNPTNFMKYQSNPKVMALISKLTNKLQGSGMNFPGFPGAGGPAGGGFPGGFPGFPGANFNQKPPAPDDDGLD